MKTLSYLGLITLAVIITGCGSSREQNIKEIRDTEAAFAIMAAEKGIPAAFAYYAADSGIVLRHDSLIKGKIAILNHYKQWKFKDVQLQWSPDYVDVAESGELGYTYGRYHFSYRDSTGAITENRGVFHTVWKRQPDGSWRFVWD
jgi:ketosteroid isomerase-like protein